MSTGKNNTRELSLVTTSTVHSRYMLSYVRSPYIPSPSLSPLSLLTPPLPPPFLSTLEPKNLDTLCHSIVLVAQDHCHAALHDALVIEIKHKRALQLFHQCHAIYDAKAVSNEKINELGKSKEVKAKNIENP